MAIETNDETTIMAEIKAGLFMEAFEALAGDLVRRDRKSFEAAAPAIISRLERFNPARIQPGPHSTMTSQELQDARRRGQEQAFEAINAVVQRVLRQAAKAK